MELLERFGTIRDWYEEQDRRRMASGKTPTHKTNYGLWGASGMLDMFEFFMKIRLERFDHFADYGCGDGRITLIAALFTRATGIEGDLALCAEARQALKELGEKLALKPVEIKQGDYYEEDHSQYDMIYLFMDHPYPRRFEKGLKERFEGYLISYNDIHLPYSLKKGKTYWIQQIPIVSYPINIEEEELFRKN